MVAPGQARADLLAVPGDDRGDEVVAPRPGGLGHPALEVGGVDLADRRALRRVHDEVDPRGRRLGQPDRELDRLAARGARGGSRRSRSRTVGVVAVARQVDEHRDVAAVGVASDEEPQLAALARVHGLLGHRGQLVDRGVEELVARIGLEGVHQRLAVVAQRREPDALEHGGGALAQQRDPGQRLGVGRAGVEAEEATLADHLAVLELLDADVVEVRRAVHGRAGVGLGEHQHASSRAPSRPPPQAAGRRSAPCPGRRAGCRGRCRGRRAGTPRRPAARGGTRGSRGT